MELVPVSSVEAAHLAAKEPLIEIRLRGPIKNPTFSNRKNGADDGNRTRVFSLGS